jgi:hypothetical protein
MVLFGPFVLALALGVVVPPRFVHGSLCQLATQRSAQHAGRQGKTGRSWFASGLLFGHRFGSLKMGHHWFKTKFARLRPLEMENGSATKNQGRWSLPFGNGEVAGVGFEPTTSRL